MLDGKPWFVKGMIPMIMIAVDVAKPLGYYNIWQSSRNTTRIRRGDVVDMEEHLIREVSRRFRRMPRSERVKKIRQFMGHSQTNKRVVQKLFPELYQEVVANDRASSAGELSELAQPVELYVKPR